MNKQITNNFDEPNMHDGYYDYQGGYISYDPALLTEYYTVKGFEGKVRKKQDSESRWC